jgi:DNA-binding MarR family transcriptional regulator
MATSRKTGTELFLSLWAAWESVAPAALLHQNPRIVLTLLERSARPGGVFQTELKQELGVNQPYLSKLSHKMHSAGWIKITKPKNDRRRCLTTTTAAGTQALADLKNQMNPLTARTPSPSKTAPRGIRSSDDAPSFDYPDL